MATHVMSTRGPAWLGPQYLDEGWAPAPRYLLRRSRILHHMKKMTPGRAVEVGCASGALLSELSARGYDCVGVESSAKALALARRVNAGRRIEFLAQAPPSWTEQFDYCLAFEVLEHIEQDGEALAQWASWLKRGGKMLLSVPAHPRLWNARDVWAGHYRRYRRADLQQAFGEAGLAIDKIECYGFPLANALEFIIARNYRGFLKGDAERAAADKAAQTAESGIERATHIKMFRYYARFPGSLIMRSMIVFQTLFLNMGLGNGFLVVATKR